MSDLNGMKLQASDGNSTAESAELEIAMLYDMCSS